MEIGTTSPKLGGFLANGSKGNDCGEQASSKAPNSSPRGKSDWAFTSSDANYTVPYRPKMDFEDSNRASRLGKGYGRGSKG